MATLRLLSASGPILEITRETTVVGRDPSCDIVLADGSVSRKHARIEQRGDNWAVVDQGSANGTFLDSIRVAEAAIKHGQELRFGAMTYRVEIEGAREELLETMAGGAGGEATVLQPIPAIPPTTPPTAPLPRPTPPPALAAPPPPPPKATLPSAPPPPPPAKPAAPSASQAAGRFSPPPPAAGSKPLASSPVPSMGGGDAAPAKKGKGPVVWIVGGCCGCLLLVLLGIGGVAGSLWFATKGAAEAVTANITLVREGQVDAAYMATSQAYQSQNSLEEFRAMVDAHPALRNNKDSTFPSRSVHNDTGRLQGVLTSTAGGIEAVVYETVKEGGVWKVSQVSFE